MKSYEISIADNVVVHHLWEATEGVFDYGLQDVSEPLMACKKLLVDLYGDSDFKSTTKARIAAGTIRTGDAVLVNVVGV